MTARLGAVTVRPAEAGDIPAITAIYAHHVRHGFGTFDTEPPEAAAMAEKRTALIAKGYPYFVAEADSTVIGYAYAGPFRDRPAYRHTVEDSIYVAETAMGHGVGRALLSRLIVESAARGFTQMVAVIGDSGNTASIGLHARLGFKPAGKFLEVGHKHGRWLDVVFMQLALTSPDP